jgi:hypothetical protein
MLERENENFFGVGFVFLTGLDILSGKLQDLSLKKGKGDERVEKVFFWFCLDKFSAEDDL